jgi:hypothetical protein
VAATLSRQLRSPRRRLLWVAAALVCLAVAACVLHYFPIRSWFVHEYKPTDFEQYARARFLREHPGAKPLNYRIGQAAVGFYKAKPMGKFVLCVTLPDVGNDCSDFAACAIDEGLGARARFKRHSQCHLIGEDRRYFDSFYWDRRTPLLPGDTVTVRHSPWYAPRDSACWHEGIIGSDGMVYDFEKLKSWPQPRYGRHPVGWFVQNCPRHGQIIVARLRPEYRYYLQQIPIPRENPQRQPGSVTSPSR